MKDQELRKLKRQDLLELLILQSKDVVRLQEELDEKNTHIAELNDTCDRLKDKLNEKDDQIDKLKDRLDQKDARIVQLESQLTMAGQGASSGTNADQMMNKIYEVAQNAVKEYMKEQDAEK